MFHGRKTLIKKPKGKCSMEENILILIVWHLVMGLFRQNIIDKHEWYELWNKNQTYLRRNSLVINRYKKKMFTEQLEGKYIKKEQEWKYKSKIKEHNKLNEE